MCDDLSGMFELMDPNGVPSGYIDVTLKWKFTYFPPSGSSMTAEQAQFTVKETPVKLAVDRAGNVNNEDESEVLPLTQSTPVEVSSTPRMG